MSFVIKSDYIKTLGIPSPSVTISDPAISKLRFTLDSIIINVLYEPDTTKWNFPVDKNSQSSTNTFIQTLTNCFFNLDFTYVTNSSSSTNDKVTYALTTVTVN